MQRRRTLHSAARSVSVALPVEEAWGVVTSGETGPQWYLDAAPFRVGGGLDRLIARPGRRRRQPAAPGRRFLILGDRVGIWQVSELSHAHRRLVLTAQLRTPGRVRLVTEVARRAGETEVTQRLSFRPRGVAGRVYLLGDLATRGVVAELVMLHLLTVLRRREP